MNHITFVIFYFTMLMFSQTHFFPLIPSAFLSSHFSLLLFILNLIQGGFISHSVAHKNTITGAPLPHCYTALARLALSHLLFFLSHAARQSVGTFGMWPPAQAEEQKINRPEVSQGCQPPHWNEVQTLQFSLYDCLQWLSESFIT